MAYSELVKNFDRARERVRRFFVRGFERRGEAGPASARSYDDERRRAESWLAPYMQYRRDRDGKTLFISVDSRSIPRNPLYAAYRSKSFTALDISFHFLALDILAGGEELTASALARELDERLLPMGGDPPDESTVRKKLAEYERLGIVESRRDGRERLYRIAASRVPLERWRDAALFFSEADPLGVIGSYIADRLNPPAAQSPFSFKHRYIQHALDAPVLLALLSAIGERRSAVISLGSGPQAGIRKLVVCPCRIFISAQTGRQYLLAYHYARRRMQFYRLDSIRSAEAGPPEKKFPRYIEMADRLRRVLWGVSTRAGDPGGALARVEMLVRAGPGEEFVAARLSRERRVGSVEPAGDGLWRFSAEVTDASELLPWLRTFIGRIERLVCTDPALERTFRDDLARMAALYPR